MLVGARDLEVGTQVLEGRMREECAEVFADQPLPDIRVPVAIRAERGRAVVDVEGTQPVEAQTLVDLVYQLVDRLRVGDVVAGGEEMARVEAHAEARMAVELLEQYFELVERAADRSAGAGRI